MAIGPIGSVIYTNQNTNAAAAKQTSFQNKVDLQNIAAGALANEKGKEIQEVRPTEKTYKINPEKEHEKEKREEESGAKEQETSQDNSKKKEKDDKDKPFKSTRLDISV